MLRYEENKMRRVSNGMTRSTTDTTLKPDTKEAKKGALNHNYGAVEDIFKQAINRAAAENAITSSFGSLAESQQLHKTFYAV